MKWMLRKPGFSERLRTEEQNKGSKIAFLVFVFLLFIGKIELFFKFSYVNHFLNFRIEIKL